MKFTEEQYNFAADLYKINETDKNLNEAIDELILSQEVIFEAYETYKEFSLLNEDNVTNITQGQYDKLFDFTKQIMELDDKGNNEYTYTPVPAFQEVKKITDMKFPANIIFLITQIIKWLGNLIKFIISKLTNAIRNLVGLGGINDTFDFSMELEKTKEIETSIGLPAVSNKNPNKIKLYKVKTDEFNPAPLTEGAMANPHEDPNKNSEAFNRTRIDNSSKGGDEIAFVQFDMSDDIFELNIYVKRLIDLFDSAFGSNGEYLFGTEDLEAVLKVFKNIIAEIDAGETRPYELSGNMASFNDISASRVKTNLQRTYVNVENLKNAYKEVLNRTEKSAEKLANKKLQAFRSMDNTYLLFTSNTIANMIKLINLIEPKLKDAKNMQKKLEKMQTVYTKLIEELQKQKGYVMGFNSIVVSTPLQKQIDDLYAAAKYMTMTISVRITGLAIIIQSLNRVKELLARVAEIGGGKGLGARISRMGNAFKTFARVW